MPDKTVDELWAALGSTDFDTWYSAKKALKDLGARAVPELAAKLRLGDDEVTIHGLEVITAVPRGAELALPELPQILDAASPRVIAHAVAAIGAAGSVAGDLVPRLLELLDHPDQQVVGAAANALSRIGVRSAAVVRRLLAVATDANRSPAKRSAAIQALSRFGSRARPALDDLLRLARTDERVQSEAIVAIARVTPFAEVAAHFRTFLSSERPPLEAIGKAIVIWGTDARGLMPAFLAAVERSEDFLRFENRIVAEAIRATRFDDPSARRILTGMRGWLLVAYRHASFDALAALGESALDELFDSAAKGDSLAVYALGESSAPHAALPQLLRLLDEYPDAYGPGGYDSVVPRVIATMALPDELVVPTLTSLTHHARPAVRAAADEALRARRDFRARPLLFTARYPPEIAAGQWYPLAAQFALPRPSRFEEEVRPSASPHRGNERRARTVKAERPIPHGVDITIEPRIPGLRFNPAALTVTFAEDEHEVTFRMTVAGPPADIVERSVNGEVRFSIGPIEVASVPVSVFISEGDMAGDPSEMAAVTAARAYRSVFVSYAHKDHEIVERMERYASVLGTEFIRDTRNLRPGEKWEEGLRNLIDGADVFQLFWSANARASRHVDAEWRHALSLRRPFFIRPCYWERPMPLPPPELAGLHFAYLHLRNDD